MLSPSFLPVKTINHCIGSTLNPYLIKFSSNNLMPPIVNTWNIIWCSLIIYCNQIKLLTKKSPIHQPWKVAEVGAPAEQGISRFVDSGWKTIIKVVINTQNWKQIFQGCSQRTLAYLRSKKKSRAKSITILCVHKLMRKQLMVFVNSVFTENVD